MKEDTIKELLEYAEQKNIYIPCGSTIHMGGIAKTPLNFKQYNALRDAFKKQIAMPVHENNFWDELSYQDQLDSNRYFCINCDAIIEENYAYCVSCGQKIDWE